MIKNEITLRVRLWTYLIMPVVLLTYIIGGILGLMSILKDRLIEMSKVRRLIVLLLLMGMLSSPITISVVSALRMTRSEKLDYLIRMGYRKSVSKLMSEEIIRQIEDKDGMGFGEYFMRLYYKETEE